MKAIYVRLRPEQGGIDKEIYELWEKVKKYARKEGITQKRIFYEILKNGIKEVWRDVEVDEEGGER
jgi:DNA polymerase sigma